MSCLVLPVPDHPSAGSLRPTLTQSRKGKGNVSRAMALVRLGPAGTAETPNALWISCHQQRWTSPAVGELPTGKDSEGWGHSTGWVLLCAQGSRVELSGRMTSPGSDTHTTGRVPWVPRGAELLPSGG